MDVQQGLHAAGDNIPRMQGELQQMALDDQKKRLDNTFYDKVYQVYGLRPEGSIDYNQFRLGDDNKTLYWAHDRKWTPDGKKEISYL